MSGGWMLPAAAAALGLGWFALGRPLARCWGGGWWARPHGRRAAARALRAPEPAAGIWPCGTGWALLARLAAGAGLLWLSWPEAAAAQAGGWAALAWLLAVWMLLGAVRDYALLHAAAHSGRAGHGAQEGLAALFGGRLLWRLFLLLAWSFCVLLLALLAGGGGLGRLLSGGVPSGEALRLNRPDAIPAAMRGSAATAALLLTGEALALGVLVRYARPRQGVRAAIALGMLAAALAVALACPVALSVRLACLLILISAFCAAAAPSWLLAAPRGVLGGWLLLGCLGAGVLAGLFPAILSGGAASPAVPAAGAAAGSVPALCGRFWALLCTAGGGTAAGLQALAVGRAGSELLRPGLEPAPNDAPRQERAVFAVGFGGRLLLALLAASALALLAGGSAAPAAGTAAAGLNGFAAALAERLAGMGAGAPALAAVVWLAAVLAGLAALDAAAAAGRSALEALFGSAVLSPEKLPPWRKLLRSRPVASLLTVLPALLLTGAGPEGLLPLLDGLGWLLAGLALLAAVLSHRQAGRAVWPLLPVCAALLAAGWLVLGRQALRPAGSRACAAAAVLAGLAALAVAAQGLRRLLRRSGEPSRRGGPRPGQDRTA